MPFFEERFCFLRKDLGIIQNSLKSVIYAKYFVKNSFYKYFMSKLDVVLFTFHLSQTPSHHFAFYYFNSYFFPCVSPVQSCQLLTPLLSLLSFLLTYFVYLYPSHHFILHLSLRIKCQNNLPILYKKVCTTK